MKTMRYTVVTVNEQGDTRSRLGRWVGKMEALRIAAMWTRAGSANVKIVNELGETLVA